MGGDVDGGGSRRPVFRRGLSVSEHGTHRPVRHSSLSSSEHDATVDIKKHPSSIFHRMRSGIVGLGNKAEDSDGRSLSSPKISFMPEFKLSSSNLISGYLKRSHSADNTGSFIHLKTQSSRFGILNMRSTRRRRHDSKRSGSEGGGQGAKNFWAALKRRKSVDINPIGQLKEAVEEREKGKKELREMWLVHPLKRFKKRWDIFFGILVIVATSYIPYKLVL
jgi:hypothetical protein